MKILSILLLITALNLSAKNSIFDQMDEKTAQRTGVSKLTDNEKKALIKWINSDHLKNDNSKVTKNQNQTQKPRVKLADKFKNMGFRPKESSRQKISAQLLGDFQGWTGKTLFKLDNGQVWKQTDKARNHMKKMLNPEITISPKSFGSWQLKVKGYNRGVKVTRIK